MPKSDEVNQNLVYGLIVEKDQLTEHNLSDMDRLKKREKDKQWQRFVNQLIAKINAKKFVNMSFYQGSERNLTK